MYRTCPDNTKMGLFATTFLVVIISLSVNATDYDYTFGPNGPERWGGVCNSGTRQSPIRIDLDSTISMSSKRNRRMMKSRYRNDVGISPMSRIIRFTNYDVSDAYILVKNKGLSVEVTMKDDSVRISGGGLANQDYILSQFHFHWGETSETGSEHWLNGKQYPMEMHLVHYNAVYADLATAATKKNGLAVLGFLFEIQEDDNPDFDALFDSLVNVQNADDTYDLTNSPPVENLFRDVNRELYVRYDGSLTTPGCYESVQWTVFIKPIPISESQMMKIRAVLGDDGTPVGHNFRPTQCLNGRKVYRSPLL